MKKLARKKLVLRGDVVRILRGDLARIMGGIYPPPMDSDPETDPPCSDNKSGCGSFGGEN